jgi:hypothetical protein
MRVLAVETHLMLQVVWVALVASVSISALFSFVIVGSARASEARRAGRSRVAAGWAVLAAFAFLLFAVGVVLGVQVMITK